MLNQKHYDILPLIPNTIPLLIVDKTLMIYTHPRPVIRRTALLLLVLTQLFLISILVKPPSSAQPRTRSLFRRTKSPQIVIDDPNASQYRPVAATVAQDIEFERLQTLIESRTSSYDPALFEPRGIGHSSRKGGEAVTAVILHWKRKRGLDLVLQQISRYPFIREIIIWNNRGIDLKQSVRIFVCASQEVLITDPHLVSNRILLFPLHLIRIFLLQYYGSIIPLQTCMTLENISLAHLRRTLIAISMTTIGSTFTLIHYTQNTSSAARMELDQGDRLGMT